MSADRSADDRPDADNLDGVKPNVANPDASNPGAANPDAGSGSAPGNEQGPVHSPTRRDRFRPLELLVIAGIVAVFVGLIVLLSARSPQLAFVFGGVAFIASLVLLAMLALTGKPTGDERSDLDEQNRGDHNRGDQNRSGQDRGRQSRGH